MIEDGDIGYHGASHASFVPRVPASVAGNRATVRGELAARSLRAFLAQKFPAVHESRRERLAVTPDAYWSAISRIGRGVA